MSVTKLMILIIVSVTMIVMTGLYRGYSVEAGLEQKLHLRFVAPASSFE
jgi:hypothetical protein